MKIDHQETPITKAELLVTAHIKDPITRVASCVAYRRKVEDAAIQAITTAAERMGVDPLELATALQNGEIAELVEALENIASLTKEEFESDPHEWGERLVGTAVLVLEKLGFDASKRNYSPKLKGQGDE